MKLNINTDAVVSFTNTLEKMHRSALPNAIRGTLNNAAFDVKTNTMQKSADVNFIKRQPNFFKANSRFEKATGFNVNTMKSTVGMVSTNLQGADNHSVKDLEQQEHGGSIDKRSFIPTNLARKGNSARGLVRSNARLSAIKNIIKTKNSTGKNAKEKFVVAASVAGKGGFVLDENILWRIDSFPKSSLRSKRTIIKRTPIYSFKSGRKASVHATNFMREATLNTAKKMETFYFAEAKRQIEKLK